MELELDGRRVPYEHGDTVALAALRAGLHPGGGGCLCLAGDCPNCLVEVDGEPYKRACQVQAAEGLVVHRHPADGAPVARAPADLDWPAVWHEHCDVVVVGAGHSGTAEAARLRAEGRNVLHYDERPQSPEAEVGEAVGVYAGGLLVVNAPEGIVHVHAREVVVATGAAEIQPVCPGADLEGIFTARAAGALLAAGVISADGLVHVDEPPLRFEGGGRVEAVVLRAGAGNERRVRCRAVAVALGTAPRDGLLRQGAGLAVRAVGTAAGPETLPPPPRAGVVCRCIGVTVVDLESAWSRGFRHVELVKRSTTACTGTCQGAACLPHIRAFLAAKGDEVPPPITARPLTRQITLEEAAAGLDLPPVRRTPLDAEHRALGAQMERFGGWWRPWRYGDDVESEYRAVRERVSVCDVSTLGKILVSGRDVLAFLERLYPCHVADLRPGRSRYALLLDEAGYVIDDGLLCRDDTRRFYLTFTTGGGAAAEAWLRDWAATFAADVRILDRTAALGAVNVTGPRAAELLGRLGLETPPSFMGHARATVAGVPVRVLRLGFTGEASFELHAPADRTLALWQALIDDGRDLGCRPHGLDALLTLRLEKGHVIVGQDTDFDSTPRRLGMEWAQRLDKPDFVGRHALTRIAATPPDRQLVGLELDGPAPVEGAVLRVGGALVGHVTSSRFSPVLGRSVCLGFLDRVDGDLPGRVELDGREARRVPLPFYDREGARARA
jgi:glycine cleavage system aminomethyltransferase T